LIILCGVSAAEIEKLVTVFVFILNLQEGSFYLRIFGGD
jgi:hypothetical protein